MNLNQVTIPSSNLANAVSFYQKLGFLLIVDALPRYARFELPKGDSTFSIHHETFLSQGKGITLYFEVENLDATVSNLRSKGIVFQLLPTDQPWLWQEAHLKDPDGNQLILYKAGKNRKNPPWRIN